MAKKIKKKAKKTSLRFRVQQARAQRRVDEETKRAARPEPKEADLIELGDAPKLLKGKKPACAIFDGDIMVYHATMSCLVETYDQHLDCYQWSVSQEAAWESMLDRVEGIASWMNAGHFVVAFSGPRCFRKDVHAAYKAHRSWKKPLGYWPIVQLAMDQWETFRYENLEADDILGIFATDPKLIRNFTPVIVSDDKDLNTIPGLHLHLRQHVDGPRGIFNVTEKEADTFHLVQTLAGDSGDGYNGLKGIGAVRAAKLLGDASGKVAWRRVVSAYKEQDRTAKDALENARCAHILRHGDYDFKTGKVTLWRP